MGPVADTLQAGLDEAVVEKGNYVTIQIHLGRKAAVFLVALAVQFVYVFRHQFDQAYGLCEQVVTSI
jgi:hypothetical protein